MPSALARKAIVHHVNRDIKLLVFSINGLPTSSADGIIDSAETQGRNNDPVRTISADGFQSHMQRRRSGVRSHGERIAYKLRYRPLEVGYFVLSYDTRVAYLDQVDPPSLMNQL